MQDLTECEQLLQEAFPTGRLVDLRAGNPAVDDPIAGAGWGSDRTIRAEVIRGLLLSNPGREQSLCNPEPVPSAVPAIRLTGARIAGPLDLAHTNFSYPLCLEHCWFEKIPDWRWMTAGYLDLGHSVLPGILADNLRVEADLVVSHCYINGEVRLYSAYVGGDLNLDESELDFPSGRPLNAAGATVIGAVFMIGLAANGGMRLVDTHISGALDLSGATLSNPGGVALEGSRISVDGPVFCRSGFTCKGELRLRRARINEFLDFAQARLFNPGGNALYAPGIVVDGGVSCRDGSILEGELNLLRARVSGDLDLSGAHLCNPGGVAFEGRRLTIGGAVFCRNGFSCNGEMRLARAHITGFLDFAQARLSNPGRNALSAPSISADGGLMCRDGSASTFAGSIVLDHARITPDLDLTGARLGGASDSLSCAYLAADQLRLPLAPLNGTVDLSHAQLGLLDADPQGTPAGIYSNGLTYTALNPLLPARARIEWLCPRQADYMPQPYEQLAAAYRRIGHDADARSVLHVKEQRRHQQSSLLVKLWGLLQDVTTGYGYRPARAGLWLIALLALGTTIFSVHPPAPLKSGVPAFNPFFYTLDLLIPVVTYGQQAAFGPKGIYQWFAYGLMTAGWLLATTIITGITRALYRG
jgi:hypothetical protein